MRAAMRYCVRSQHARSAPALAFGPPLYLSAGHTASVRRCIAEREWNSSCSWRPPFALLMCVLKNSDVASSWRGSPTRICTKSDMIFGADRI